MKPQRLPTAFKFSIVCQVCNYIRNHYICNHLAPKLVGRLESDVSLRAKPARELRVRTSHFRREVLAEVFRFLEHRRRCINSK
jgi:hypothetical protein